MTKVINMMLQYEGPKMSFRNVDRLLYVGDVSAVVKNSGVPH